MNESQNKDGQRRSRRLALVLAGGVVGMVALSYAAAVFYQLICREAGLGGATQIAQEVPDKTFDRTITVRFDTAVQPDLPWAFYPVQREIKVKVGENALVMFRAENKSDEPVMGQAVYNVTPDKIGPYFFKVACFCFDVQTLAPHEVADMPVSLFLDPKLLKDRNADDVGVVTLSYTFFKASTQPTQVSEAK
ncbi:MAG TPA: cytochrome c oxidase assembly protein [Aliidongia sp.]|uniref:cytochrome c oxidase assembly protein n=1 Tax=Aliidongia sp. TaxID=1914230 RepID=UPI002DDD0683|nr:cytochrome c oxidase assembly protein [Aliidongia sp.]HEV2674562.1 cytochrome c oxidase assembly protein [Aliidongia sp.]